MTRILSGVDYMLLKRDSTQWLRTNNCAHLEEKSLNLSLFLVLTVESPIEGYDDSMCYRNELYPSHISITNTKVLGMFEYREQAKHFILRTLAEQINNCGDAWKAGNIQSLCLFSIASPQTNELFSIDSPNLFK